MRAGMPAGREIMLGDWVVRVSGGPTKRVNSANAAAAGAQVAPVLSAVERIYRAAGLPSRFRLTPLVDPASDAALAREGYEVRDESWTMAAPAGAQIATMRCGSEHSSRRGWTRWPWAADGMRSREPRMASGLRACRSRAPPSR